MSILEVNNVSKSFGGVKANVDISMSVEKGKIFGLIGPNGSGKTTLFNSIVGTYPIDQGSIKFNGKEVSELPVPVIAKLGLLRTFQQTRIYGKLNCVDNMLISHKGSDESILKIFSKIPQDLTEKAENLLELFAKSRGEGFGAEVKRRILLGTFVLSSGYYDAYYLKAQKVRSLIRNDFQNAFTKVDAIITPTTPTPAFKAGEKSEDPLSMYLSDIYTIAVNLAGLPALSMPVGMTSDGLPIGMQIIGDHFREKDLFSMAYAFECDHCHHKQRPSL